MGNRVAMTGRAPAGSGFWLAVVAFTALLAAATLAPSPPAPLMRVVAICLLALAVVFSGLPFLHLRRFGAVPAGARFGYTTTVAERGLYAVVRHPQYLGFDFLAWGLATFFLYWGTILPAIAVSVGLAIQARAEEDYLLDRFPDAYRAYRRTVPRFGLLTGLVRYLRRRRRRAGR